MRDHALGVRGGMRKEVDQRSEERLALRELDVISDGEKRKIKRLLTLFRA